MLQTILACDWRICNEKIAFVASNSALRVRPPPCTDLPNVTAKGQTPGVVIGELILQFTEGENPGNHLEMPSDQENAIAL